MREGKRGCDKGVYEGFIYKKLLCRTDLPWNDIPVMRIVFFVAL